MVHCGLRVAAKQAALWRPSAPLDGALARIPRAEMKSGGATPSTLLATMARRVVRSDGVPGFARGYSSVLGPGRGGFRRFSSLPRDPFPTLGEALARGLKVFTIVAGGTLLVTSVSFPSICASNAALLALLGYLLRHEA